MAALLHDVLDDTDAEYAEIEAAFGEQVSASVPCAGWLTGRLIDSLTEWDGPAVLAGRVPRGDLVLPRRRATTPVVPRALPRLQVASMVASVSQLSTTNQIVRRRLRVESAQPTKEEEAQLR